MPARRRTSIGWRARARTSRTPSSPRRSARPAAPPSSPAIYAHRHRIVDNNTAIPPGTAFFPQLLQQAGYETAFIGKWHMGGAGDDPQPGFDHWVSFRGQGTYLPDAERPQRGRQAGAAEGLHHRRADRLRARLAATRCRREQPFFLYLSHKAVHAEFVPADAPQGHATRTRTFVPPRPWRPRARWRSTGPCGCRTSATRWHGVDFPYHSDLDIGEYYKRYAETLLGVDDSVGRVLDELRAPRPARFHARRLHGRQRLRLRRARPDRQAHGLRGIDARAAAGALSRAVRAAAAW